MKLFSFDPRPSALIGTPDGAAVDGRSVPFS